MTNQKEPQFEGSPFHTFLGTHDSLAAWYITHWSFLAGMKYSNPEAMERLYLEVRREPQFDVRVATDLLREDGTAVVLGDGSMLLLAYTRDNDDTIVFRLTGEVTRGDVCHVDYGYEPPVASTKVPLEGNRTPRVKSLVIQQTRTGPTPPPEPGKGERTTMTDGNTKPNAGCYEFRFLVDDDTEQEALNEALAQAQRNTNDPEAPYLQKRRGKEITVRGNFGFDQVWELERLALESEPWYEPAADSVVPPIQRDQVEEALDCIAELQDNQEEGETIWNPMPLGEIEPPALHALYRMVAKEWIQPDWERPDIGTAVTPAALKSRLMSVQDALARWSLDPREIMTAEDLTPEDLTAEDLTPEDLDD